MRSNNRQIPRGRRALAFGAIAAAALAAPSLAQAQTLYVVGDGRLNTSDTITGTIRQSFPNASSITDWIGPTVLTRDGSRAYVLSRGGVFAYDPADNLARGSTLAVDVAYGAIAITPDDATVLVTSPFDNKVTPIDTATNTLGTPIPVPSPKAVAVAPDGETAYVATGDRTLTPIDLRTLRAGTPISLAQVPSAVAITPDGALALVAEQDVGPNGYLQVVDLATGTAEPAVDAGERLTNDVAVAPDGTTAYVSENGRLAQGGDVPGAVLSFDIATRTFASRPLAFGWQTAFDSPWAITVSGDSRSIYAAVPCEPGNCVPGGGVYRADAASGSGTLFGTGRGGISQGPSRPTELALAPDPSATFSVSPGVAGGPTSFYASLSSNAGGTVTSYTWDFGDGSAPITTTGPEVSHTYGAGSYTVTLTTTNAGGCAERLIYTGQMASCSGRQSATARRSFIVTSLPPQPGPARARTAAATELTKTSALLHGTVDLNGRWTTARFEYGLTTRYGTKTRAETIWALDGSIPFATRVEGLAPNHRYHYRLVVSRPGEGFDNGQDFSFTTPADGAVKVSAKTLRVKRGAVRVKVRCDSSTTCRGRLVLQRGKTRYAVGTVAVKSHRTVTKRLQLTRAARTRLQRARSGQIRATLTGSFSAQKPLKTAVKIVR